MNRRKFFRGVGGLAVAAGASTAQAAGSAAATAPGPSGETVLLPDRENFLFDGIHLNAAYCHPIGLRAAAASTRYLQSRMRDAGRNWPVDNARDEAVSMFASLINAAPTEVAIVPSTLEGENLIGDALGLGPKAGVVTDPFHYDAALAMYGERHRQGMPLGIVAPRDNRIDYAELESAIGPKTRLVAVSLVSSDTGYRHDLKAICEIAHKKGALVYADIIQAVGAMPIDVKNSGVDFCCTGMYKWLMGEFGSAFLYVRSDRLADLKRVQLGWRGIKSLTKHFMPFDPPGPLIGDWTLGTDTASIFECSTPSWSAHATVVGALGYINDIGFEAITRHRAPMLDAMQEALPRAGFLPLTPRDHQGPTLVFAYEGARDRFGPALKKARIMTSLYKNKIRIAPSVHNDLDDIEALLRILAAPRP